MLTFVQNCESGPGRAENSTFNKEEDGPTMGEVWVSPEDLLLEQDLSCFPSHLEQETSAEETGDPLLLSLQSLRNSMPRSLRNSMPRSLL